MVHWMHSELRDSQVTPVPEDKKDKGKGKEREVDIEELDGPPSSKGSEPLPGWDRTLVVSSKSTEFFLLVTREC